MNVDIVMQISLLAVVFLRFEKIGCHILATEKVENYCF